MLELAELRISMSDARKLIDLCEYLDRLAEYAETPVTQLKDHGGLRFHEQKLTGRTGIHFNQADQGEGPVWMEIERLPRRDPPAPDPAIADWIKVSNDPNQTPEVLTALTLTVETDQAQAWIKAGRARPEHVNEPLRQDAASGTRDVRLNLDDDPDTRSAIDRYLNEAWHPWAAAEAPRRETMAIYDQFFGLQQQIEIAGAETPRELVWGVGLARWETSRATFDIPLLQCRVEIEIDPATGSLRVRPRQPGVGQDQLAELNMTPFEAKEIAGVQVAAQAARRQLQIVEDRDEAISPFDRTTFEAVLRTIATNLDTQGEYLPDGSGMAADRSPPEIGDRLQVTDTWVVFSRQRPSNYLRTDLHSLRESLSRAETDDALPSAARRLVDYPPDTPENRSVFNLSPGFGATLVSNPAPKDEAEGPEVFYFPKPFNDDQRAIIRRLEKEDGVVVQGPPGTGKTHTIANLICHYMAIGKRVLVVSRGAAALSVLRDQIPAEIRDLTISLLSNDREGLRQLETAVGVLADETATLDATALDRDIQQTNKRITDLEAQIAEIDRQIKSWAEAQAERIQVDQDRALLPDELARHLVETQDLYSWFTDRPPTDETGTPDVADAEMADLARARRQLGGDIVYLDADLPEPANLPDSPTLEALHRDLVEAADLAARTRGQRIPQLAASVPDAGDRARALRDALDSLIAAHAVVRATPWLANAYRGWVSGRRNDMEALYDELLRELVAIAGERARFVRAQVEIPRPALSDPAVREGLQRMNQGRRAFSRLAVTKGTAKRFIQRATVDGRAPSTPNDARLLLDYIDWRRRIDGFVGRWRKLVQEFDLPEPPQDGSKAGQWIQEQSQKVDALDAGTRAYREVIQPDLETLFPTGPRARAVRDDPEVAQQMLDAVRLSLARRTLEASRARVDAADRELDRQAGEVGASLRAIIADRLGRSDADPDALRQAWEDGLQELRRLRDLSSEMARVRAVTERLEAAGAPGWAERLRAQPADADGNAGIPGDWRAAWRWAQLQTTLQALDGRSEMQRLTQQRQNLWRSYEQAFAEVVRLRTYAGLYQRMSNRIRSALQQFTHAVRRIGRGTGSSAPRHRRAARKAMAACYDAVPVWIMPEWRVSESMPAELGLFDLVIIDEASQSDARALPAVLRGKKVLCVGDDKQVTPVTPGFPDSYLQQLEHNYLRDQVYGSELLPGASFYDLMGTAFPGERIMLKEHFRCVEPIIRFSSREFYSDKIRPMRVPRPSERLDPPLIDILVPHGSRGQRGTSKVNKAEADVIVAEIARMIEKPEMAGRRIGVISLIGHQQARHIQGRLMSTIGEAKYHEHGILCGDAATFQGSEADVVFLSMVVAGKVTAFTSTMYQQRFNVALSRAKDRMFLVRSVPDDALKNPDDMKARAVQHFRDPMPEDARAQGDLSALCESELERDVYSRLYADGYDVRPQVPAAGYRIDLVVEGENDARLAIEMDGDLYHGPETWWTDFQRQLALERVGWRFWRCWGSSWTLDPEGCYVDVTNTLAHMGIEPTRRSAPAAKAGLYTSRRIALSDGTIRPASDAEMATGTPAGDDPHDATQETGEETGAAAAEETIEEATEEATAEVTTEPHGEANGTAAEETAGAAEPRAQAKPADAAGHAGVHVSPPGRQRASGAGQQGRLPIVLETEPHQAEIVFDTADQPAHGPDPEIPAAPATSAGPAPAEPHAPDNQDFFGAEAEDDLIKVGDEVTFVYDDAPKRPIVVRISDREDNPARGILHKSKPLSRALLGNATEDVVEVEMDHRTRSATILRVHKLQDSGD